MGLLGVLGRNIVCGGVVWLGRGCGRRGGVGVGVELGLGRQIGVCGRVVGGLHGCVSGGVCVGCRRRRCRGWVVGCGRSGVHFCIGGRGFLGRAG